MSNYEHRDGSSASSGELRRNDPAQRIVEIDDHVVRLEDQLEIIRKGCAVSEQAITSTSEKVDAVDGRMKQMDER